jgi:hypothetical protein
VSRPRHTTTWACQDDRLGIPGADLSIVPDAVVDAELALALLAGDAAWKTEGGWRRSISWRGYFILLEYDRRVQLTNATEWLAVSKVPEGTEDEQRQAALDWGIRAALALAVRKLE